MCLYLGISVATQVSLYSIEPMVMLAYKIDYTQGQ